METASDSICHLNSQGTVRDDYLYGIVYHFHNSVIQTIKIDVGNQQFDLLDKLEKMRKWKATLLSYANN